MTTRNFAWSRLLIACVSLTCVSLKSAEVSWQIAQQGAGTRLILRDSHADVNAWRMVSAPEGSRFELLDVMGEVTKWNSDEYNFTAQLNFLQGDIPVQIIARQSEAGVFKPVGRVSLQFFDPNRSGDAIRARGVYVALVRGELPVTAKAGEHSLAVRAHASRYMSLPSARIELRRISESIHESLPTRLRLEGAPTTMVDSHLVVPGKKLRLIKIGCRATIDSDSARSEAIWVAPREIALRSRGGRYLFPLGDYNANKELGQFGKTISATKGKATLDFEIEMVFIDDPGLEGAVPVYLPQILKALSLQ
jgi:hypothetical protein